MAGVELANAYVSLHINSRGLRKEVETATKGAASDVNVGADTKGAQRDIAAVSTQAAAVGSMSPTIRVKADTKAAQAQLSAVSAQAGASNLAVAGMTLGPAVVPGTAAAIAGLAGIGGAGAAGAAGAGVAAFALAGVSDAFTALGDAQDKQGKTAEQVAAANEKAAAAMSGLSPAGQSFVKYLNGLRGPISELQQSAADGFLPGLQAGMKSAGDALSPFSGLIGQLAGTMGYLAERSGKALGGPEFQNFFRMVEANVNGSLSTFGSIVGNIARAFTGLAIAFSPVSQQMLGGLDKLTDRFANFANEGEGGGLSKFVAYVQEMGPKVAKMLGAIGRAFGAILVAMAPWGAVVVGALTKLGNAIADMPVGVLRALLGAIVGLTLAWKVAAGAARAMAAAQGVATAARKIGTAWTNRQSLAEMRAAIASKARLAATKAMTIAQRALNLVMRANPIGLIITAIMLLVGVFVLLYKKNDTARRIMDAAWRGIKGAISATVDWFTGTAWPALKRAFDAVARVAMWLWNNGIKPAFDGIASVISWWYQNVVKRYFALVSGAFRRVASVAQWLWKVVLAVVLVAIWKGVQSMWGKIKLFMALARGAFRALGAAGKWLYNKALKPAFGWIAARAKWLWGKLKWAFNVMKAGARVVGTFLKKWLWTKSVKPVFQWIADRARWLWGKVKWVFDVMKAGARVMGDALKKWLWTKSVKPVFKWIADRAKWLWGKVRWAFDKIKGGANSVKTAFGKAKDGIKTVWSKTYSAIRSPIVKAIRWLNKHFIGKLNKMLKGIPGVDLKITPIPTGGGFAKGGILPGYTPMSRGDDVLTPMRSGEGVLASEGLRDSRSRSMFLAANSAAKRGVSFSNFISGAGESGYAKGGIVALGKRLQKMGYDVSEHPAFGGVVPGAHSANGYHYKGGALDINADPWLTKFRSEPPALDRLNRMLKGDGWNTIWRAPNHYDHLHVDVANGGSGGLGGVLKSMIPDWASDAAGWVKKKFAGLTSGFDAKKYGLAGSIFPPMFDKIKGAVTAKVKKAKEAFLSTFDSGDSAGVSGGGITGGSAGSWATKNAVKKVAKGYGWDTGAQWNAIDWIVNKESSWNPRAANPNSSARGLFQKMTSIHGPVESTVEGQARWGLNYFKKRYGSPLAAQSFWRRNHWYAEGTDSAKRGWSVVGEDGPELVNFSGGQQVFNRDQTLALARLATRSPGLATAQPAISGPVTVNVIDRDGSFVERMRGEIQANESHNTTRARMGAGRRF